MNVEQLILNMHRDLSTKVDKGFEDVIEKFQAHEVRDAERFGEVAADLRELQNTRKTIRWFIAVAVVALLSAAAEHVINHRADPTPVVQAAPAGGRP